MLRVRRSFTAVLLAAAILAAMIPASGAELIFGETTGNLRLRSAPSLSSGTLAISREGDFVQITERDTVDNAEGSWYAVVYNGKAGFMFADFIAVSNDTAVPGFINAQFVNFRAEPNTTSAVLHNFSRKNTQVDVTGMTDGWYAVHHDGMYGYVRGDFITLGNAPAATPAVAASAAAAKDQSSAITSLNAASPTSSQRALVELALTHLGKPYVYGAAGPNAFDCSGFTSFVYKQSGVSIQRTASDQFRINGTTVAKENLLPGDLVFFKDTAVSSKLVTHVGIYIGNGSFVHAGSGGTKSVKINDINSGYYARVYHAAKRVL